MTKFGRTLVGVYFLLLGTAVSVSCAKKKTPELTPRVYELPELDDEELEDLPEDASKQLKE